MRFTIITINRNNRDGLRRTIESVVGQTCRDYEYVVIDGASTDGSVEVIKRYADHITYWVSEPDRGIYHAMNKGVARAHGDYCLFMNSGDCMHDTRVLERIDSLHTSEDVIIGKVTIDDQGHTMSPPPATELTFYHLFSGAIPHQAAFIRTTLLKDFPYDESLKIVADWKFFLKTLIIDNRPVRYLDLLVAKYDTSGLSTLNPELVRKEKEQVLAAMFPPRILADYRHWKQSECLTQTLTPQLRRAYTVDRLVYRVASFLLKFSRNER
ncbi:MAG: glycosyltransferase [Prevotella sp.]|nr:glycosyltransferase [Prevotella sp.]